MNKQRKVLITITYNEMGIIIDTKAEEVAQPNLQPTCNKLATDTIQTDLITKIQNGIKATDANDEYSCGVRNGLRWCISLIDDKEPLYENCPSAQEWIPCSERLPEEEKRRYWICTDTGYQCECRWTNVNPIWTQLTTDWHWNIFDVPQYSHVIAWMPLPEPWKGDNE